MEKQSVHDAPPTKRRRSKSASTQEIAAGRENFIPLRKADLRRVLANDCAFTPPQRQQFEQFCRLLEAAIHYDYHQLLERLKDCYAPFDPDADTRPAAALNESQRERAAEDFFVNFIDLVDRANFQHLGHEQLAEALDHASAFGINLDVDFTVFERLEVFARGSRVVTRPLPGYYNGWRKKTIDIPVYQRLILVFRLRDHKRLPRPVDTNTIYVKIFKDIPKSDLEMLLPGTRVRMSWVDHSKIVFPTLSGVALAIHKIVAGAMLAAITGIYGLLALLGLMGGTLGYGIKSFFAYLNTKDRYQLTLTRSLYYKNLDNNSGVVVRLLDEAEEQEFREAIIAWFLLWKHASPNGWTSQQLDIAAEQFLLEVTGEMVDFEISDALDKLVAMKLVESCPNGNWKAVPIDEALAGLDASWDAIFGLAQDSVGQPAPHFFKSNPIECLLDSGD